MKLSSKARYAVEAMFELALHPEAPVTLASIAEGQRISQSYMEQLFMRLRRNGLIEGARGPGGGYRLGADPHSITVASIVTAVDADSSRSRNKGAPADADTTRMWNDLSQRMHDFLSDVSLGQLVDDFRNESSVVTPIGAGRKTRVA